MQEDFLHYIWNYKKLNTFNLKTTTGEAIVLKSVGQHNHNSGPDFFNAQLKIGEQLWAGNVEVHLNSSDWFLHNHETDKAYDNVILHVVWDHDTDVFRRDNTPLPTLQLKNYVDLSVYDNYLNLFEKKDKWINCENDFEAVDDLIIKSWLERLFFERLERKSKAIDGLLKTSKNDWEAVLFKMLAKNFGVKVNSDSFFGMAESFDFSIVRKTSAELSVLEALFMGQIGLLDIDVSNGYYSKLFSTHSYLKQKFGLKNHQVLPVQFFRLRPASFPTIRLSQLANLYHQHQNLFSKVINSKDIKEFYELFKVSTSEFWETHYTFEKVSKKRTKNLSESFIDLLLINTILPIKFSYAKQKGEDIDESILNIAVEVASEKNTIIKSFNKLKKVSKTALDSQALIQLKKEYCDRHKCTQCAIGNQLLGK